MGRLDNKVAMVTGAARGMGESHARRFVQEGATVFLSDLSVAAGAALAAELGPKAIFVEHNVTERSSWQQLVHQAEAEAGSIDILVNNAGILGPVAGIVELTEDDYHQVCHVNQHSVCLGMQAVIPAMLKAGKGSIDYYDDPAPWFYSLELLAKEVAPRVKMPGTQTRQAS